MTSDRTCAIIAAAGKGLRMQNLSSAPRFTEEAADKIFLPLKKKPLIAWTVDAFEICPSIDEIILVLREENLSRGQVMREKEGWKKVQKVLAGGPRRQDSVLLGLVQVQNCQWVVVHDGARPCVTVEIIEQGLREAEKWGAAVAAVPVKDTVKKVDSLGMVSETLPRELLWEAQTPQVFRYDILKKAYEKGEDVTDDASLVEKLGLPVKIYMGSYENIKITTQEDLKMAEMILANRRQTANGKQQTANGKRQTANSKWQTANGRRQTANGKQQMANGRRQTANSKRQTVDGRRQTADGKQQTVNSRQQMANGRQ